MNDPLFLYIFVMTLLCILSTVVVIVALRAFGTSDSVIEDPHAETLDELERLYIYSQHPSVTSKVRTYR